MTIADNKILKTLELLVMLSHSRRQFSHGLTPEQKATLTVSKQLIIDAGLTVPEFTNSVREIAKKGYVWHVVIFDDELRSQIDGFINSDQYSVVLEELKKLDTEETSNKLKQSAVEQLSRMLPHSAELDQKEIDEDHINVSEAFTDGIEAFKKMRPDEIALVILMPFRDINTLLVKMNDGKSFDDIQDDGFWYDQNKYEFHIDSDVISTNYQGKPNLEHYILKEFYNGTNTASVTYEDLAEFDVAKGEEAYRDAMRNFIKKNDKLRAIFTPRKYNTEFHPEQYEHTP